ncbi:NAD(P)H-dependent oxidoreductase [soil metagenome]
MSAKVAVIYYSATGNIYRMAQAVEEGAKEAGAEVRFRKVQELAPEEAIKSNQGWHDHFMETQDVPEVSLEDLEWADAYLFGTPTRFGNVSAQLKQFLDQTGGLWFEGKLVDKVVSGFTSAQNQNGGQESTLLSMYNVFAHWGAIVVTPGYTDPLLYESGGNPYGASSTGEPDDAELASAKYLGRRVSEKAALLAGSKV